MSYYTKEFYVEDLSSFVQNLKDIKSAYDREEEMAFSASMIFTWFGIIGGPAGVCVTASVLAGGLAYYFDTIQNTIQDTIDKAETYKDMLQNDPSKDVVRMRVYTDSKKVNGVTYIIPIDFQVIGIRVNGSWVELY